MQDMQGHRVALQTITGHRANASSRTRDSRHAARSTPRRKQGPRIHDFLAHDRESPSPDFGMNGPMRMFVPARLSGAFSARAVSLVIMTSLYRARCRPGDRVHGEFRPARTP
jgi:hypothetical protein